MPKTILTDISDLTSDKRYTFITEDVVVGGSTLAVQSIIGFESLSTSSGQILCIGKLGDEKTELRRTSNSTGQSPSAAYKWVYLRDTLQFDHPQDTQVTIIDWDRLEIDWAASVNGTKATIAAYPFNITPDTLQMVNTDTSATAGYYFVRFNETIGSTNSSWSDAIPYAGFDDNSVFSIKQRAVSSLGEEVDGKLITDEFLNQSLWEARREYHESPGKRPFRRKYNIVIGSVSTGSYRVELPTDVERPYSSENIFGIRVGTNKNMDYYDKKEFDFDYRNIAHSTLDVPYTSDVSTSIWLVNGRDFSDSATISVEGTNIGLSRITGSTNSFYIYSHGDWSTSAGSDAWEHVSLGLPNKFTIFQDPGGSAYVYFNRPFDTMYVNQNIWADYYRTLLGYDSDGDILDEPDYDMYIDFLKAKIKYRKSRGELDITKDSDFKTWQFKKGIALSKEYGAVEIRIYPSIDHLPIAN